jgi:hypothetical protein
MQEAARSKIITQFWKWQVGGSGFMGTMAGVVGPVSEANIWWVVMPTGVTEILFWSGQLLVAIQRSD